jgi:membrane-associated phospholipid phosphatase
MDTLHRLDDRLLVDVNDVARHSGWLHGAVAAGSWLASRALGAIAAVAAVLMAFARVYVGVHYPWDVAAGLVFGALVALLGRRCCGSR